MFKTLNYILVASLLLVLIVSLFYFIIDGERKLFKSTIRVCENF